VRWIRAAEAFFVERGYPALVRRSRQLLAEAGAPVPRPGRGGAQVPASLRAMGVTSRELDVLVLVVDGRTNKEIAAELFLSTKTVERHLSSLFDRTGVRNRIDLAELAAGHLPATVGETSR
jgi:DNA-binding NarL/FixJ family response regulator